MQGSTSVSDVAGYPESESARQPLQALLAQVHVSLIADMRQSPRPVEFPYGERSSLDI
ncbi:hypothetical protein BDV38DRAFT_250672 [Aspergillus pseudotamarii]|uniref:Uncharacterized protein n=1 Tax=Aspergillus pseudotamarii TaxID=132259 RepID=A0A5N6SPY0_ASPPS|nr:uncharacterized protein BDV38DRAFT_250672 [Aspergillus pseudotamarii]KAE8135899.1 hypothetical protein BDV38DRAFT_250672 [Aspergillus pseudotamarii]